MTEDSRFSNLVVLACHDLRTPLATVHGFAHTLARLELDEAPTRYVEMISAATEQLGELIDQLALASRIEAGRYDPVRREIDTARAPACRPALATASWVIRKRSPASSDAISSRSSVAITSKP